MTINVTTKTRKIHGAVKARFTAVAKGWKSRHDAAFAVLHPQVQVLKSSPTAQIGVSTGILGLLLTGHVGPAAGLFGTWLTSKPLTHVVAGSVACIGTLDAAIEKAVLRFPCAATEVQADEEPRAQRRKRRGNAQQQVTAAPARA